MVPLRARESARRALDAPDPVDALLARIRSADTPYQAWAAVALADAGDARHRPVGRAMAQALRADLPPRPSDWEHGDVACFALLADHALTREERQHVTGAVPPPHDDPGRRARFYASPLYVYLTARGLAGDLPDAERLAALVADDARQTAPRPATDLPSLILQLATALELGQVRPVEDGLLRAVHAQLITSAGEPEGAIAVRWLLEHYGGRWPASPDATALQAAAERYAGTYDPTAVAPDEMRPEVAVMRLETLAGRRADYRLLRAAHVTQEVAARVAQRRFTAAVAYAVSAAVLWGVPAWLLVDKVGAAPGLTYGAAFMTWAPTTLWATLWEYGRLRRDGALAGTIALCLGYYAYVAYVALTGGTLEITGKEAVEVIAPVVIGTMFGAAPALRTPSADPR